MVLFGRTFLQQLLSRRNEADTNHNRAAVVLVGCGPSASDISIHDAATGGHIKAIKQHLAAGTNVNAKDVNEWTPLHHAALHGQKKPLKS